MAGSASLDTGHFPCMPGKLSTVIFSPYYINTAVVNLQLNVMLVDQRFMFFFLQKYNTRKYDDHWLMKVINSTHNYY